MTREEYKDKGFALVDLDIGICGWCSGQAVKDLEEVDLYSYVFIEVTDEEADRIQDDGLSLKDLEGRPQLRAMVETKIHLI